MSVTYTVAYSFTLVAFGYIFVPSLWLFIHGIEAGMDHIDRVYPYPQSRQPLHANPVLIYLHMYANITALGLQIFIVFLFHPPRVSKIFHRNLALLYSLLVTIGTLASMVYASKQAYGNDGGKSGIFAFGVMALATFSTLFTSLYYIFIRGNAQLHFEWAFRNFAILFGNGVIFRVLANSYLLIMPRWGADFYSAWCQMIYLSWLIPLFVAEQYLSSERSRKAKYLSNHQGERQKNLSANELSMLSSVPHLNGTKKALNSRPFPPIQETVSRE